MSVYRFLPLEPAQMLSLFPICSIQYTEDGASFQPTEAHGQEYQVERDEAKQDRGETLSTALPKSREGGPVAPLTIH